MRRRQQQQRVVTNNNNVQQPPNVRYYYYDPKTVSRDAQGNVVVLPRYVYDPTTGQAIALQSLASSSSAVHHQHKALRLETPATPPRAIRHHNVTTDDSVDSSSNSNYTHPETAGVYHRDEKRGMMRMATTTTSMVENNDPPMMQSTSGSGTSSMLFLEDWGKSHVSDSSVIVVTVGVMALLVGALSARKLRSRNMLSACIENETLEDDAAYDALYTTHQYNTFQQGWKGDLEKFDV
jgi:hypothetical protein